MTRISFSLLALLALLLSFSACKSEDPCEDEHCHDHEQELITTVRLTFSQGSVARAFVWKDADGDGGNSPLIDTIRLSASGTWLMSVEVLDESKTPAENITTEILEESDAHQFFYRFASTDSVAPSLSVAYSDTDANGYPIGLAAMSTTGAATGKGSLRVTLLHEPTKNAPGVAAGDPTAAGGEADIDVYFPVVIE